MNSLGWVVFYTLHFVSFYIIKIRLSSDSYLNHNKTQLQQITRHNKLTTPSAIKNKCLSLEANAFVHILPLAKNRPSCPPGEHLFTHQRYHPQWFSKQPDWKGGYRARGPQDPHRPGLPVGERRAVDDTAVKILCITMASGEPCLSWRTAVLLPWCKLCVCDFQNIWWLPWHSRAGGLYSICVRGRRAEAPVSLSPTCPDYRDGSWKKVEDRGNWQMQLSVGGTS